MFGVIDGEMGVIMLAFWGNLIPIIFIFILLVFPNEEIHGELIIFNSSSMRSLFSLNSIILNESLVHIASCLKFLEVLGSVGHFFFGYYMHFTVTMLAAFVNSRCLKDRKTGVH